MRPFALPIVLALILSAAPALAGGRIVEFNPTRFTQAQLSGQPITVIATSRWDPTSEEQMPVMERLSTDFLYPNMQFFHIDYDRMKGAVRDLRITQAGTVIVYKGRTERGREIGMVGEMELRHLLDLSR